MSRISYNDVQENSNQNSSGIGFFSLKDDGDEAIVRFLHDSVDTFDLVNIHEVTSQNKTRKVDCIRSFRDPLDKCPFCNAGYKTIQRFYIHLLEYQKDENGNIVILPRIWERSTAYATTLKNLIDEYGPLSDCIFKIHRDGAKGDMQTKYSILFGNPNVYKEEYYPKDTSAFDNYSVIGTIVMSKSEDEMNYYLQNGEFENTAQNESSSKPAPNQNTGFTPTSANNRNGPRPNLNGQINRPQRFY